MHPPSTIGIVFAMLKQWQYGEYSPRRFSLMEQLDTHNVNPEFRDVPHQSDPVPYSM